jgi:predicted Zn-dependent protease
LVPVVKLDPRRRSGWFHHAAALHRLGRAADAREVLLPAVDTLGEDSSFFYELARLCCILHRIEEARAWLGKRDH